MSLGLQMKTVQNEFEEDYVKVLSTIKNLGFKGIEFDSLNSIESIDTKKLKKSLDELGLEVIGMHATLEVLKGDISRLLETNRILGNTDIILSRGSWTSIDAFEHFVEEVVTIAYKLKDEGFNLYYHNHSTEFELFEEKIGLEVFYDSLKEDLVQIEFDTFWAGEAEQDCVRYLENYKERCDRIHISPTQANQETIIEFAKSARANNIKWIILENNGMKYELNNLETLDFFKKIF